MQSWLQRMSLGDAAPLEALYNRYGAALYSAALEMLGDEAAAGEAVEEVFARLWKEAGVWDSEPGSLFGKLSVLTRYQAQDQQRSAKFRNRRQEWGKAENPDRFSQTSDPAPGEKFPVSERAARVKTAMDALPEARRELLRALYVEGETCSQAASRLGKKRQDIARECQEALEILHGQWKAWAES
jgi:RNA polymerase sigma-70 factor (ECF subfamily)